MPRIPTGSHPIVEHIRKLHIELGTNRIVVGPGLRLSRKSTGSVLELDDRIKHGRKGSSADNIPRWL